MSKPIKLRPTDGKAVVTNFPMCRRHREEIRALSEDADILKQTVRDLLAGAVVLDRKNVLNLWAVKFIMRSRSLSYRAKEALAEAQEIADQNGAEWVTISASTTLRHLLNEYGERLLGYDSVRDELTFEVLSYDIFDSSSGTVRVLVRKEEK